MGPIQQSLNSITTTAMDAIRTKEALASTKEREQREAAEKDFNARVKQQEEDYVSGKIKREELDPDVDKELFGSREQSLTIKRVDDELKKQIEKLKIDHPELKGNMSKENAGKLFDKLLKRSADSILLHGPDRFSSRQSYQLSRIFDVMQDMVKGNQYAQQAAIQLSDKIDTALNHMQSRKRWR